MYILKDTFFETPFRGLIGNWVQLKNNTKLIKKFYEIKKKFLRIYKIII